MPLVPISSCSAPELLTPYLDLQKLAPPPPKQEGERLLLCLVFSASLLTGLLDTKEAQARELRRSDWWFTHGHTEHLHCLHSRLTQNVFGSS